MKLTTASIQDSKNICIPQSARTEYWTHCQRFMAPHPAMREKRHNPIGISGDDAQYTLAGLKVICVMLNYILYEKPSLELSRFPFFLLRGELSLGTITLHPMWRVAAWSLNIAYTGKFPRIGPAGKPLDAARLQKAGSILKQGPFALNEIRGDWKWHYECWALRRHYNANRICLFCDACKAAGPNQWTRWENYDAVHQLNTAEFFACSLKAYVNPLSCTIGFTPRHISFCSMHVSNLGILAWLNASVIMLLVKTTFFGGEDVSLSQKLVVATLRFRAWCKARHIPQPSCQIALLFLLRNRVLIILR